MKKTIIYSIILCCSSLVTSVSAQQIGLRFPDTTMVQGDTIILPLMVDSTLTGQEVYSFNLDVRYDTYYFEYVGISNGELTSSFGEFIVNSNSGGALLISGANGSAISGTGVLLYIHLKAYRHNIWGSTMSLYSTSIFNEGLPHIIASSGRVSIQAAPTITIGPNDADLLVGESQMFRVYGDTVSPFLFSVEDSTVGKVNAEGLFTAMAPGYTKVKVTDINGNEDFTNNEVIVYGVQLSTSDDLREWQGSSVEVPVFIHNVSGENLISGSFQFSFNDYYLTYNDYNKEGSLLENASVEVVQLDDENLMVNFASSQALVGDSTLLYLSFDVSRTHTGYSYLDFSDILFNEGVAGLNERGRFQTINYQTVNLSYTKTDLIAREVLPLNFYGGLLPYTYASSDSSIARISTEGVVTAIKGGEVTFSATDSVGSQKVSNLFHVYDTYIAVPDTTGPVASDFLLPIYMGALSAGVSAEAFQIKLSYKMPELEFLEIVTTGSLTQGWSLAHSQEGNHLNISGASTGALSGDGVLFYVKFHLASELTINERVSVTIDDLVLNEGHPTAYLQNGYIKCVKPEDLLVSKLIAPLSDCDLTAEEEVVVEIKNNGYVDYHAGDTLMVSYRVYYQNTVYDTIVLDQDFPMKSVMNYTFKEKADFSQDNKQYGFEVQTELSSERDANPSNDRIYTQIFNFDNPELNLGSDIATCVQEPIEIVAPTGFDYYEWSTGAIDTNAVSIATTSTVWLEVTNQYGCTVRDTIEVIIHPIPEKPEVSFASQVACVGDTLWLEAPAGYADYQWTTDQEDSIIGVTQSGEYGVMVYNEGRCVSDTSNLIDVMFYEKPTADFSYTNDGLTVTFVNLSQEASTYEWHFGDGKSSTDENPTHTYLWVEGHDLKSTSVSKLKVSDNVFGYVVTLMSTNGSCDEYHTDTIPAELFASDSIYESICIGETYEFGGEFLDASGAYYRTYNELTGNEIVEVLFLTVVPTYNDTMVYDICEFDAFDFNGRILTEAGFYTDTFLTSTGCDSIINLDLSIIAGEVDSIEATICDGSFYLLGSDTLWTEGVYFTDEPIGVYPVMMHCTRTVLTLSVEPAGFVADTLSLCESDLPFDYNDHIFPIGTTSGEKIIYLESPHGCLTEIILQLTIAEGDSTYVIDYGEICPDEIINGSARVDEDYDTLMYKNKCDYDSIVIHRWDMVYPPIIDIVGTASVVINSPVVYSVDVLAEYIEWFIEDTAAVLNFLSDSSIEVTFNEAKEYALQAGVFNQCGHYFDTLRIVVDSAAMGLNTTDFKGEILVYPNPAQGALQFHSSYEMAQIAIYTGLGIEVYRQDVSGQQVELNLSAVCQRGIYFAKIKTHRDGEFVVKVLIE